MCPINLNDEARKKAGIPDTAARYARELVWILFCLFLVIPCIEAYLRTRKAHAYVATLGSFSWGYPHPEVDLKAMRKYGLDMHVSAREYS